VKRINIFTIKRDAHDGYDEYEELCIEIDFHDASYKGSKLMLRFLGIREFYFYHRYDHNFRYVENYTLLKHDDLYYLCIAPEDEWSPLISENDQDFILFESFEGYFVEA
jgi:hypothetical protein